MSRLLVATLLAVLAGAAVGIPAEAQERRRSGDRDYRRDRSEHRAVPPRSPYRDRSRVRRGDRRDDRARRGDHRRRGDDRRRGDYRRRGDHRRPGGFRSDHRRHDRRYGHDQARSHRGGHVRRAPGRVYRPYRARPGYGAPRVYRPYRSRPAYRLHRAYRHPRIVFHVPHRRGHGYYAHGPRHGHVLHGASLGELLGAAAIAYLVREVLGVYAYDPHVWTGRWHDARYGPYGTAYWDSGYRGAGYDGGVALQLFHEGTRVAELADFDLDGQVDLLLAR